jgi:hypothetical protein
MDYAHLPSGVFIEIEGGVFSGGRHTRPTGFVNDSEKYAQAMLDGWRGPVRLHARNIQDAQLLEQVIDFMRRLS